MIYPGTFNDYSLYILMNDGNGNFTKKAIKQPFAKERTNGTFPTCCLQERYVVVSGGSNRNNYTAMRSAERYDLQNDMWEKLASLTDARECHLSCSIGDSVYTFDVNDNQ